MKRYIHNLKPIKYVENDCFGEDYVPLRKVQEMLSEIEDELIRIETILERGKDEDVLDALSDLREKL